MVKSSKDFFLIIIILLLLSFPTSAFSPQGSIMASHENGLPYRGVKEVEPPRYEVIPYGGGGFKVKVDDEEYYFQSSFSYPNAGYNKLVCTGKVDQTGEDEWNVKVRMLNSSVMEVTCYGKYYNLKRLIIRAEHKIAVQDTFRNLKEEDIGIILSNNVTAIGTVKTLYVCGINYLERESVILEEPSFGVPSDNPTLLMGQKNTGIGLVAEDDVYKVHLGVHYEAGGGSLYIRHFGLGPNASYIIEWSIYPVSPPDYWIFINSVRRDWKVNFTIEGPLAFMQADFLTTTPIDELKRIEAHKRWRLITISPWYDYWDGYGLTKEEFASLVKPAIANVKKVNPNSKTLMCVELPLKEISPEQLSEYVGSIPVLSNGELSVDKPYQQEVPPERRAKGYKLYDVYPEVGNKRFKELMDYMDFAIDVCGYDGVYFDSFMGHCYGVYNTYDKWDGYSVDMDPKSFTIANKYASLTLITREALKRLIEYIQSKGKIVVTNSRPPVRCIENLHIYTFYEKNEHSEGLYVETTTAATHLYTPICLGDIQISDSLKDFMDDVRLQLRHGTLYYPYAVSLPEGQENYGVIRHMFPFTPMEIHGGWLIGEERIITMVDGIYGWDDNSTIKVHLFDVDGREIPAGFQMIKEDSKTYVDVVLKEGQIVILERAEPGLRLHPPIASFTYSPSNPNDLSAIQFIDTSKALEGNITCWYWDFGDGTHATIQNPAHTYAYGGVYRVSLSVGDENGVTSTHTFEISVASYKIPLATTLACAIGILLYFVINRRLRFKQPPKQSRPHKFLQERLQVLAVTKTPFRIHKRVDEAIR